MSANQPHPSREELFAYRDGELKSDRRVVIEAHVLGCHLCRELIDDVSRMEADLSVAAPVPRDSYFERLTEQVMTKVAAADATPALERRRPEAEAEWEEKQALKPKLPWFALVSTASAAAAVIVVGVLILREGAVWRRAPSVAVLERSAPDAARSGAKVDSGVSRAREGRNEVKKRADRAATPPAAVPPRDSEIADKTVQQKPESKVEGTKEQANEQAYEAPALGKLSDAREKDTLSRGGVSDEVTARLAAPSASADLQSKAASENKNNASEPIGGEVKSLFERYGLPPVWGPGVSDDLVLRAEPALRNLYRVGGAASAADSARVRLYLAEAARVRAGAAPDSEMVDEIVHHYRRAIRLAGNDAELRRVASERLQDFLDELGDEPALHTP